MRRIRTLFGNKKSSRNADSQQDDTASMTDAQVPQLKRSEPSEQFFARYSWRLPIELTPSGQTLGVVGRARKHRSSEFAPLSRVMSLADNKDVHVDHIRIKWTNGDLLLDPSKSLSRRNSDFDKNPEAFLLRLNYSCALMS